MDRHERLSYHAPRVAAEPGPVRAELKLHGNARDDADCEIDSKDPDPEAGSIVPALPVWPEAPRLHEDNQEGQAHGKRSPISLAPSSIRAHRPNKLGGIRWAPRVQAMPGRKDPCYYPCLFFDHRSIT